MCVQYHSRHGITLIDLSLYMYIMCVLLRFYFSECFEPQGKSFRHFFFFLLLLLVTIIGSEKATAPLTARMWRVCNPPTLTEGCLDRSLTGISFEIQVET